MRDCPHLVARVLHMKCREGKAGASNGGLNEDAADYPIRKFSLHFHRACLTASNKTDSQHRSFDPLDIGQTFTNRKHRPSRLEFI